MKFLSVPAVLAAALFSTVVIQPWLPSAFQRGGRLVARVSTLRAGHVQVYPDKGDGFAEHTSVRLAITGGNVPTTLSFDLPYGNYRAFRLDPLDTDGTVTLESIQLFTRTGRLLRDIGPAEWKPANQIASLQPTATGLVVNLAPGATDAQLVVKFDSPVELQLTAMERAEALLQRWSAVLLGVLAVLAALDRSEKFRAACVRTGAWLAVSPQRAIGAAAVAAVVASAYPVVFLGKSYVSPDLGATLLYDNFPTLPGYQSDHAADVKGSDIGALAWQDVPFAVIQRRALLGGELPLWNRYNSCGTTLLGQGQSMFGDPLHFLPILANSAAWAWDLKFLLAKWLFAFGLGWCVWQVTRRLSGALLVAAVAPFLGFFVYRLNHPAFFSMCYAPWVLVTWLGYVAADRLRLAAGWLVALMLANWTLLNSGTVKEAYMLLLTLNLAGAVVLLTSAQPWPERVRRLAGAVWAGGLFVLLAAPGLVTFADSLAGAYTSYNAASAYQIQPGLLLGFFDELFYRPLSQNEMLFNPAMNFALLGGVLYFLATLRENLANRAAMALGATALLPLSLAFGLIPARWIVQVPFLANVAHIDNTFSCVLIVLLCVLAGVGFARASERIGTAEGRADLVIAGLLLFALVFGYVSFTQAVHRSVFGFGTTFTFMKPGESLPVRPFVWAYLGAALLALLVGTYVVRRARIAGRFTVAGVIVLAACALTLLWRNGLHAGSGYSGYVMNPTARADLRARSEAVEHMRTAVATEPARGIGLDGNFFPGWTAFYSLETITGPDALINPFYRELAEFSGLERRWDWRYVATRGNVAAARPVLDLLNVRFYFDRDSDPARFAAGFNFVRHADLDIYESPTAWPRAFFTDRVVAYVRPADLIAQVRNSDGRPFAAMEAGELARDHALDPIPHTLASRTVAAATNYHLKENSTAFTIRSSGPGLAVLTEAYVPGDFVAEVDGRPAEVLRVNHAFKAVRIDAAGEHRVSFRYQPKRLGPANLAAALGALLLAGSLGLIWRKTSP